MRKYLIIAFLPLLVYCNNRESAYYNEIVRSEGLFRGVNIRDGHDAVVSVEDPTYLIADQQVYLRYEYPINPASSEEGTYKIEYYFDGEDQLHEMIFEIITEDEAAGSELYKQLVNHFNESFGTGIKNKDGFLIWKGKTDNTGLLEIALLDDSKYVEGKGYLTLQINDFDY